MLNQIILVGRLIKDLEVKEGEDGSKYCIMSLAIPRSFKNAEGVYETDFVDCKTFSTVAENSAEYCKKGDIVGIKGRIQSQDGKLEIIAEKVTFLSSHKEGEE
jgi:single-strand DNA-binding protein